MPAAAEVQTPIVHQEPISPQPPAMETRFASTASIAATGDPAVTSEPTEPYYSPAAEQPSTAASPNAMPSHGAGAISSAMIDIVSELTGYPADMLGLDMDIEADLGIDSIKRVEILSTLEDRLPGLPQVTPDIMGGLKTLGQICDYLTSGSDETDIAAHSTKQSSDHLQSADALEKSPSPDFEPASFSAIVALH